MCIRVGIELDREDFITVETKSLWTVDLRINVDAERKVAAFNLSRCTQRNIRLTLIRERPLSCSLLPRKRALPQKTMDLAILFRVVTVKVEERVCPSL